jgi:hypothetical protein
MYKIKNCEASELTKEEIKKCRSLSLRKEGHMNKLLWESKYYPKKSYDCFLMFQHNKLLAWAIVANEEVHYYTRKSERRKGLAKTLALKIHKKYNENNLKAGFHNELSKKFLQNYKYKELYTQEQINEHERKIKENERK